MSAPATADLETLRRMLCAVGIVGQIDGHDVIRRTSVIDLVDRARATQSDQRAGVAELVYPDELSDALRHVLGFPNFRCGPYAHLMRDAGADIQRKAEDEQAAVLHWLVKLVLDYGEKWVDAAAADLKVMREKIAASPTQQQEGGIGGDQC
ncbi:hypothetical protein [Ralstonia pseudosolanacearum]|uniref:hypothetical protein n=1 Tax=Ralstonia pseudosolanacearum TaxID=1310165 RepID=UPI000ABFE25F|nr:hypothetical protein [Ralstonia pseudosolanacearum]